MNPFNHCSDKFQIVPLFHLTSSLPQILGCFASSIIIWALIISSRSDTPTCDRYNARIMPWSLYVGSSGGGGGGFHHSGGLYAPENYYIFHFLEHKHSTCWESFLKLLLYPLTSKERFRPTRIDLWTNLISPRRRPVSAGLHAADTLWHAFIDFLTYLDDYPESGLGQGGERLRLTRRGHFRNLPIIFSSFEMATDVKGLNVFISNAFSCIQKCLFS